MEANSPEKESHTPNRVALLAERYFNWLNTILIQSDKYSFDDVNENPNVRGGTCNYNSYLMAMVRANLLGMLVPIIVMLIIGYVITNEDFRHLHLSIGYDFGHILLMLIATVGIVNWAAILFIAHEKRLRAAGINDNLMLLSIVGLIAVTSVAYLYGWHVELIFLDSKLFPSSYIAELLDRSYGFSGRISNFLLYIGLILMFFLPSFKTSPKHTDEIKDKLSSGGGYPTSVAIIINMVILLPVLLIVTYF